MRKIYGESIDSGKDTGKMRRIVRRREKCGDVGNAWIAEMRKIRRWWNGGEDTEDIGRIGR